ncbi:hypothetical protein, partial [Methylacidimicrobium tartarophylax]|uniref:hypothetical protein n=1 Tax=Methylacidimicrobium tartarophylax TaxID=1041768 RepID=UPI0015B701F1
MEVAVAQKLLRRKQPVIVALVAHCSSGHSVSLETGQDDTVERVRTAAAGSTAQGAGELYGPAVG